MAVTHDLCLSWEPFKIYRLCRGIHHTSHRHYNRASNKGLRRFNNHGKGPYQRDSDGRRQRSCKCNFVHFYIEARPPCWHSLCEARPPCWHSLCEAWPPCWHSLCEALPPCSHSLCEAPTPLLTQLNAGLWFAQTWGVDELCWQIMKRLPIFVQLNNSMTTLCH